MQHLVAQGAYTGGRVRYGYRLAADGEQLEPDDAEQAVVEEARKLRRSGLSLRQVAAALDRRGMRSRSARRFDAEQIAAMVDVAEQPARRAA
jgi:hypothetical protein